MIICERFEKAEDGSLFILDEAVAAMSGTAEVIKFVLREADANGVRLAITQPLPRVMYGGEAEEHERELNRLGQLASKAVKIVPIEIALVPETEIARMLTVLGIDSSLADKFAQNDLMRTLRMVEHIFHETVMVRRTNDAVLGSGHIISKIDSLRTDITAALGLDLQDVEEIRKQFSERG
jgi:hypothetical protein